MCSSYETTAFLEECNVRWKPWELLVCMGGNVTTILSEFTMSEWGFPAGVVLGSGLPTLAMSNFRPSQSCDSILIEVISMENVVSSPGVASKSCVVYETSPPLDALKNVKFPIFQLCSSYVFCSGFCFVHSLLCIAVIGGGSAPRIKTLRNYDDYY